MPISLKHINTSDTDNIKLDNVNYNFDQLVANGGGPRGPQGSIGQSGNQGTTGQQGYQGLIGTTGYQGPPGPDSVSYWKNISGTISADTLLPIHTEGDQFASVINIGHLENDSEYLTKAPLVGGKTPYQWLIHRKPYLYSNLRFLNDLIPGNAYDFKLEKSAGKDQMTMGFFNLNNSISSYKSASTSFRGSILSTDSLLINGIGTFFKNPTVFNSPAIIKNGLIIENANAGTDKIAISNDNSGLVEFKSVQELGGTVPFGTIVSILPSIFEDDNKFINNETIISDNDAPIPMSTGKGVGDYQGWYLCNGQEWTNGIDVHQVPMLGKFNYQIDDNPHSSSALGQGAVTTSNIRTHITGGSDVDMTANSVPTLIYNISSTVETSTIQVDPGSGTTFKIKQLPQIIYLGRNDLYWVDPGQNQNPPIQLILEINDANTTSSKLNPDPYTFNIITDKAEGTTYLITSEIIAPLGYYWSSLPVVSPTAGAITGGTFSAPWTANLGSGAFPNIMNLEINVYNHPSTPSTETFYIDTLSYISPATSDINLARTGDPGNTIATTPSTTTINYNFVTGYTFNLVLNTIAGYYFTNTIANINSLLGGATYTINSSTFTSGNTQLTLNITVTGVTVGTNDLLYELLVNTAASAPKIVNYPDGYTITGPGGSTPLSYTSKTVGIVNNTGASVYLWAGINQFNTGGSSSSVSGGYYVYYPTYDTQVACSTTTAQYYSNNSYILTNGSTVSGSLYRNFTNDTAHTIQMWWSSTPTGTKYMITP